MENEVKISAVIWDMDGTMLDTERLQIECWEKVLTKYGYSDFDESLKNMIGKTSDYGNRVLMEKYGSEFQAEELRDEKNVLFEAKLQKDGIPLKMGIMKVLEWLSSQEIPSVAASSTSREKMLSRLQKAGLLRYFQFIIGGDEVKNSKPHPEIFLVAAKLLKMDPSECVVFEDSHNGVIAAHEAGMHVVMIPDLVAPTPEILARTKHELGTLEEAIPLLIKIFKK